MVKNNEEHIGNLLEEAYNLIQEAHRCIYNEDNISDEDVKLDDKLVDILDLLEEEF